MQIETARTVINAATASDAAALSAYHLDNAGHLAPWSPLRSADFNSVAHWRERVSRLEQKFRDRDGVCFIARRTGATQLAAVCVFDNVVRGPFLACHLGYSVSAAEQGAGIMHEVLSAAIPHVFAGLGLHRIMANYMPRNERSGRLLQRLGFEREGLARAYLQIAGKWEDHVLTSLINHDLKAG